MVVCNGDGDRPGHCCWIGGEICAYLDDTGPVPRCKLWGKMSGPRWDRSKIGQAFAVMYPGFTCEDWPQNIPAAMEEGIGLCCWKPPVVVEIV